MQAMLIEENLATRAGAAAALSRAGFDVTVAGSVDAAKAAVRRDVVDVLVMAERVGGRLAHDVALLAEWRNPDLGTILLSDRTAEEVDEIFDLLPSLRAVLGRDTPARTLAHLALAAARCQGQDARVVAATTEDPGHAAPALAADRPTPGPARPTAPAVTARPAAEPPLLLTKPLARSAPVRVPSFLRAGATPESRPDPAGVASRADEPVRAALLVEHSVPAPLALHSPPEPAQARRLHLA